MAVPPKTATATALIAIVSLLLCFIVSLHY
jgi:hypothetical protein